MKRRNSFANRQIFFNGIFRIFMIIFEIFVVPKGAEVPDLCDINRYTVECKYGGQNYFVILAKSPLYLHKLSIVPAYFFYRSLARFAFKCV